MVSLYLVSMGGNERFFPPISFMFHGRGLSQLKLTLGPSISNRGLVFVYSVATQVPS